MPRTVGQHDCIIRSPACVRFKNADPAPGFPADALASLMVDQVDGRGTAALDWAALTGSGPVTPQRQPTLLVAVVVLEPLAGWATVGVLLGQVDEVLLAEA